MPKRQAGRPQACKCKRGGANEPQRTMKAEPARCARPERSEEYRECLCQKGPYPCAATRSKHSAMVLRPAARCQKLDQKEVSLRHKRIYHTSNQRLVPECRIVEYRISPLGKAAMDFPMYCRRASSAWSPSSPDPYKMRARACSASFQCSRYAGRIRLTSCRPAGTSTGSKLWWKRPTAGL